MKVRPDTLPQILADLMERDARIAGNQNELARRTGVAQPNIRRLLNGESQQPRDSTLAPLADFFGVSLAQLRGHEPLSWVEGVREDALMLCDEDQALLRVYRRMSPSLRRVVLQLLDEIARQANQERDGPPPAS